MRRSTPSTWPAGCTTRCWPASGFCVYNDAAVAIAWLLADGVQKVAYIDLDADDGDGVEAAFYRDPRVSTISLHESGYTAFPGTGFPVIPATAPRRAPRPTSRCAGHR